MGANYLGSIETRVKEGNVVERGNMIPLSEYLRTGSSGIQASRYDLDDEAIEIRLAGLGTLAIEGGRHEVSSVYLRGTSDVTQSMLASQHYT